MDFDLDVFYLLKRSLDFGRLRRSRKSAFGIWITPGGCCTGEAVELGETFLERVLPRQLLSYSSDVMGAKIRESLVQAHGTCKFFHGLLGVECRQVREVWKEALSAGDIPFGSLQKSQDERRDHCRGNVSR